MKITVTIEPTEGLAISSRHEIAAPGTYLRHDPIASLKLTGAVRAVANETIDKVVELGFAQ